jgi:dipeptidyl aminopeptidase/acylaminoacyl peptidase
MSGQLAQAFLLLGAVATGTQTTAPSIDQWMSLKGADNPTLSPDGRFVAYTIRSADWEANAFDDEIWIAQVASQERYQLTDAKGSSRSPAWSPDGKRLAFLSARDGAPQIYVASPPGRAALPLTEVASGVDDFKWSADGRSIAFTTSETAKSKKPREETDEYRVVGDDPVTTTTLWRIGVVSDVSRKPTPERLTDGLDLAVDDFAWSPDSRRIAFSANSYADPYPFLTYDIYVLNLGDKAVRKIVDRTGPDFFPVWSPDGKEIAYRTYVVTDKDEYFTFSAGYIAVVPADGGPSRVLTEEFDENPTPRAWAPDGIYFTAGQRTYQHLFRLNPMTRAIDRVSQPYAAVFGAFSFSSDFRHTAFTVQDAKTYSEIAVSALPSFEPKRLTRMGDQLQGWKIGTREVIEWKSKDGTPMEGVLIKPADFDPSRKYPLLVILHGGPVAVDQAIITRDMPYPAELFAAKGALVLRPNYRGSSAYGRKFRALLVRNLGIPQSEDVITGVDHLIAKGIVDPSRVGAMGWSAGGALAAFLTTTSDRFRAITVGEGVSDWRLFYSVGAGATVKPDYTKATPWDDPEYYRAMSALTYVKNARTPTLIQHREFDSVAPTVSAYELYRALKDQGVPARMIIYKGAGHLPSGLKQFRAVVEHNYDWFRKWIWNE